MSMYRYGRSTLLASCVVGILAAAAASAQQAPPPTPTPKAAAPVAADVELEEILVTGSRIMRASALEGAIPVTSVSAVELVDTGDINLGDALNDLPSLRSTYSQGNSTRFIGTAGLNWLDLRGLGVERTLVLVNSRRHITSSPGDYLVDVNTIPSELIERVDVVTGGNSAIYGSDAVAGVVNFITKRDYEGIEFRAQAGTSDKGDRDTSFASVIAGTNFAEDRGNVAVALEYGKTDALYFNERDSLTGAYSGRNQFNLTEPTAGEPGGSDGIPDNKFYRGVFNATITDGGLISPLASSAPLLADGSANPFFCGNLPEPARSQRCLPSNQPRIFSFDRSGSIVQTVPNVDFRPFGSGNVQLTNYPRNPGDLSTLRNTGQLAAGLERYSINLLSHYDISDAVRPFVEAKFVHIEADQEGQPSFWQGSLNGFFGDNRIQELRCDNPFLSAQALSMLQSVGRCATPATGTFNLSRFNVDFGGRGEEHERDTFRVVLGVDGTFNEDWRYEVAFNYGRLDTDMRSLNNLLLYDLEGNLDGFLLAIDARRNASGQIVCGVNADADPSNDRPDCVPINVFGYGAPSREALDFVNTTAQRDETAEEYVASAYMSGDTSDWFALPAGAMGFAFGAEYRIEKAESAYDELTAFGGTFLNAIQPFAPPDLKVADVFAEVRLPILAGLPFVHELTAEAAYRYSDYNNDTDTVGAYNAGLIYAPIPDVRFRGNISTSVRAPTQSDLYSPQSQNFAQIQDPCDVLYIGNNPNRAANCAAAGLPADFVNQPARDRTTEYLSGGNPTLVEEEGESITVGMVLMPRFMRGFAFAIDYYEIEVDSLIASLGAQTIINECYNAPSGLGNPFCTTVSRNPDGTFAAPAVISGGVNFAKQETTGVDFDASYQTTFDNGHRFAIRGILTWLIELNNYTNPSDPTFPNRQMSELGDPETAFNVDVSYGIGAVDLNYDVRYIGKQTIGTYEAQHSFNGLPPQNADQYPEKWYPAVAYHDVGVEWQVTEMVSLFGGVDNVSNELPPLGLLGVGGGEPYDSIGRYYYAGFRVEL